MNDRDVASFWETARRDLDGLPAGQGLNIAHEAVDRHAAGGDGERIALRWLDVNGRRQEFTFSALRDLTSRFASALRALGVRPRERVFTLLGRRPELYVTALGTFKARGVFCPLFSAFGPQPLRTRLALGNARVLVTTEALYGAKVAALRHALPFLEHVLIVDACAPVAENAGLLDFHRCLDTGDPDFVIPPTDPGETALLHFTSGTTGIPKGALLPHAAVIAQHATARLALDLRRDDVFWCTADPGWVTGTAYGLIAPLSIGATVVADEREFDAQRWCQVLASERVTVWYTAPTALRMMMRLEDSAFRRADLGALRFIASVGEALHGDAVSWSERVLGRPVHDNWWQTETGCIMIANTREAPIKAGSMGRALPGATAAVVHRREDGGVEVVTQANVTGELALRQGWPSMFKGYLNDDARYRACFLDGWYLSGDWVARDDEGYFWFIGRADDVIKSSGHLIGAVEVERVLLEHLAVADAAVVGEPDPVAGERVTAFVVTNPGYEAGGALEREIRGHARERLGAALAPKSIRFVPGLPRTRSGKIMRRLLRSRTRGLPDGDLSMLEPHTELQGVATHE